MKHDTNIKAAVKATLVQKMAACSFEMTPGLVANKPELLAALPPGEEIFVTHLPGQPYRQTVEAARCVREAGHLPVAHLAARATPDLARGREWLAQVREAADCRRILLLGGSGPVQEGEIAEALTLARSGMLETLGFERVYFAAHPEGNPDIADEKLWQTLAAKQDWAQETSCEVRLVTQFGFSGVSILDWHQRVLDRGCTLPIRIGLPGLASLKALINYAKMCGVGNSIRFLTKRAGSVTQLLTKQAPDDQLHQIEHAREQARENNTRFLIDSYHFFPLGGFRASYDWAMALRAGQFDIEKDRLRVRL